MGILYVYMSQVNKATLVKVRERLWFRYNVNTSRLMFEVTLTSHYYFSISQPRDLPLTLMCLNITKKLVSRFSCHERFLSEDK